MRIRKIGDGVVELVFDVGAWLFGCVAAETKCLGVEVGVGLEFDLRLPKLLEVRPCLLLVGALVPLFVLRSEQSSLDY